MMADIAARHEAILKLEQSIMELHSMFMEMAILVQNQVYRLATVIIFVFVSIIAFILNLGRNDKPDLFQCNEIRRLRCYRNAMHEEGIETTK